MKRRDVDVLIGDRRRHRLAATQFFFSLETGDLQIQPLLVL